MFTVFLTVHDEVIPSGICYRESCRQRDEAIPRNEIAAPAKRHGARNDKRGWIPDNHACGAISGMTRVDVLLRHFDTSLHRPFPPFPRFTVSPFRSEGTDFHPSPPRPLAPSRTSNLQCWIPDNLAPGGDFRNDELWRFSPRYFDTWTLRYSPTRNAYNV